MGLTVIKAWCPVCGEQNLSTDDVHLHTFQPTKQVGDRAFYEFVCPGCASLVRRPADEHAVRALRMGQVPETVVKLPGEMLDPQRRIATPITSDDVLDFALKLGAADALSELA